MSVGSGTLSDVIVHMAISGSTTGYVGVGFASSNTMFNSDVVLGWIDGNQQAMASGRIPLLPL